MAQQLLTFTALTEDVGLITIYNFMSRGTSRPLLAFTGTACIWCNYIHTEKYPYTENKYIYKCF